MKDKLQLRLKALQAEYQKGQERLNELEQESSNIQSTMLRISGAIQVLQELIEEKGDENMIDNFPKEEIINQNGTA